MDWQQIRQKHSQKWVLVEAVNAKSIGDQRVIDELEVVGAFDSWESAWAEYKRHHHADKWREYYCLHTAREKLDIGLMDAFGRVVTE